MRTRRSRFPKRLRWVLPGSLLAGSLFFAGGPALAGCHNWTVEVSPARVTEGGKVTVTVSRDDNFSPSQIDVSTVDETAKAGRDYTALRRTVSFTSETQQTFSVPTTNDTSDEPDETFRVHLSNPGGCAVNMQYIVGPDARVTIRDNDAAPPPPPPPPPPPATATETEEPAESPTSSPEESPSPPASPTESPLPPSPLAPSPTALAEAPAAEDGGGLSGGAIGGIIAGVVVVLGAGAAFLARRRRMGTGP